ncbi:MAG: R3H domain-containing nucleic acid-binding protein [bacterium]|nr:R3H domain-containing nucleic acid-binding protein [bacterium]
MSQPPSLGAAEELELLLGLLPAPLARIVREHPERDAILEIVLDLGRPPEVRLPSHGFDLTVEAVTRHDLESMVERIGSFTRDNRAGIPRTLHRISCIRNRQGGVVGLTCRVGRAIEGNIETIRELVESGRSILLLGRPGVGKTTRLRELARFLSSQRRKRVIVIDTSNEIGGDGDIPHPAIGRARRMQVPDPLHQHGVMIEAVENHMPEVIVIDEIGTSEEALAARTIAERGVQLVGTAHGYALENLLMNPTLSDLVGGIQSVTLSDEEARRRGTQKTVLERRSPPTFDVAIELVDRDHIRIHEDVGATVDAMLRAMSGRADGRADGRGRAQARGPALVPVLSVSGPEAGPPLEDSFTDGAGDWVREQPPLVTRYTPERPLQLLVHAVSRSHLERVIRTRRAPVALVRHLSEAQMVLVLKGHLKSAGRLLADAHARGLPVHVLRANTIPQIERAVERLLGPSPAREDEVQDALDEARDGISRALESGHGVELAPRHAYLRRLQHQLAERHRLASRSMGEEPSRRVVIHPAHLFE